MTKEQTLSGIVISKMSVPTKALLSIRVSMDVSGNETDVMSNNL